MAAKEKKPQVMDPAEREHLEECAKTVREFLKLWVEFYFMFRSPFLGEPVTVEHEARFLELKSKVAFRHQFLYEQLSDGDHYVGAAYITDLLRMIVNLEKISHTQSENYYKIEKIWHQFYINLYDSLTKIEFRLKQEDQQT